MHRQIVNRKILFPILIGLLLVSAGVSQEMPVVKPETLGLSSERLERIAGTVQRSIDDQRIAGAVTLVARRGHAAWFKAQAWLTAKPASRCAPTRCSASAR